MAKMTLLEIVQSVLNDMDSDEVNNISDTIESLQVAQIAKDTYYELMAKRDWPHLNQLFNLNSVSDTDRPNYLKLPDNVYEMEFLLYNKRELNDTRDDYKEVKYLTPDNFLIKQNFLNESLSNVTQVTDSSGVKYNIYTDKAPEYWTSFDDEYIVFNAYDNEVDTTIQGSKTQCRGLIEPSWSATDSFTPDLPSEAFPMYLAEVKSSAFLVLKQVANEKAEQLSQRQQRRLSRKNWRTKGGIRYPDYGRKANTQAWDKNPYLPKDY